MKHFYSFKTISKPKVHSQITYNNSKIVTEPKLSDMTHSFDLKINVYFSLKERTGRKRTIKVFSQIFLS